MIYTLPKKCESGVNQTMVEKHVLLTLLIFQMELSWLWQH